MRTPRQFMLDKLLIAAALASIAVAGCQERGQRDRAPVAAAKPGGEEHTMARRTVSAHGQLGPGHNTLFVDLAPPKGGSLTEGSPVEIVGHDTELGLTFPKPVKTTLSKSALPVRLPIEVADGAVGPAELDVSYYWCGHGDRSSCVREKARLEVALDLSGSAGGGEASIEYAPPAP